MATLAQMRSRVLSMEGHERSDETLVILNVTDSLNAAYREFCHQQAWWFLRRMETVTAASGMLVLDPATVHVVDVFDSEGNRIFKRDRSGQVVWDKNLASAGMKSWAFDGYDTTANALRLHLEPAGTGIYSILSGYMPDEMVADDDVPLGPSIIGDYLVWSARQSRLKEDEERQYLESGAVVKAQTILRELMKLHAEFVSADGPFFAR